MAVLNFLSSTAAEVEEVEEEMSDDDALKFLNGPGTSSAPPHLS